MSRGIRLEWLSWSCYGVLHFVVNEVEYFTTQNIGKKCLDERIQANKVTAVQYDMNNE